jgi:integrase
MNFALQSEVWLTNLATRKRRPAKSSTLATFRAYIRRHIVPGIGEIELFEFGNAGMRKFVEYLATQDLSPGTTTEIVSVVKQIVASAVDQNGDELFPRKWNSAFIDCPQIEDRSQPSLTPEQIEQAIRVEDESSQMLFLLLASSGLRIGEAMALRAQPTDIGSFFANGAITVRTSMWRGQEQSTPKTPSARRTVELARPVADRLSSFAAKRSGFLFGQGNCVPIEHRYRQRLESADLPSFHAFRRFRTTWLRKQKAPEDLIRVWLGHADKSITDGYSKLSEDVEYRKEVAEKVGVGFVLR